jgi:hypothetical protein
MLRGTLNLSILSDEVPASLEPIVYSLLEVDILMMVVFTLVRYYLQKYGGCPK